MNPDGNDLLAASKRPNGRSRASILPEIRSAITSLGFAEINPNVFERMVDKEGGKLVLYHSDGGNYSLKYIPTDSSFEIMNKYLFSAYKIENIEQFTFLFNNNVLIRKANFVT